MTTKKKSTTKKSARKSTKKSSHTLSTAARKKIPTGTFAFPAQRKEPLEDASHVRNAIARFDQVKDVSDAERSAAFRRIKTAAKKFGVDMPETNWKQLGKKPHTGNSAPE
jgi:hypothetical protein